MAKKRMNDRSCPAKGGRIRGQDEKSPMPEKDREVCKNIKKERGCGEPRMPKGETVA